MNMCSSRRRGRSALPVRAGAHVMGETHSGFSGFLFGELVECVDGRSMFDYFQVCM